MSTTSGTRTAYPFGAPELTPGFYWGLCYSIFSFLCSVLQIIVGHFVLCLLAIVLSVIFRFMASGNTFDIFKLFFQILDRNNYLLTGCSFTNQPKYNNVTFAMV